MFGSIGKAIACLLNSTSSRNRSWQIASAVAAGIAYGLLPLGSVISVCMFACLCLAPIHLPLAIVTALATMVFSPWIAPIAGQWGLWSLEQSSVLQPVMQFNRYPLVSWLRLNNTVVHGSLMLGALQSIPTFLLAFLLVRRLRRTWPIRSYAEANAFTRVANARPTRVPNVSTPSSAEGSMPQSMRIIRTDSTHPWDTSAHSAIENNARRVAQPFSSSTEKVESLLADYQAPTADSCDASDVAHRACELAASVDEMLMAFQSEESPDVRAKESEQVVTLLAQQVNRWSAEAPASPEYPFHDSRALQAGQQPGVQKVLVRHESHSQHGDPYSANAPLMAQVAQHEEALRYLLQHLREIKKGV